MNPVSQRRNVFKNLCEQFNHGIVPYSGEILGNFDQNYHCVRMGTLLIFASQNFFCFQKLPNTFSVLEEQSSEHSLLKNIH